MQENRRNVKSVIILLNILFLTLCSVVYWRIWVVFFKYKIVEPFYSKGTLLLVLVYALILLFFSSFYGGYKIRINRITEIIFSQMLALALSNVITYLQISLIAREMLNIAPLLLMTTIQILVAVIWAYVSNRVYILMNPPLKLVFISSGGGDSEILLKLNKLSSRFSVSEIVVTSDDYVPILDKIETEAIDGVVISNLGSDKRDIIAKRCYDKGISLYIVPEIVDILVNGASKLHIFDTPLFIVEGKGLSTENAILKRAMDIFGSIICILFFLPIMLLASLAILFEDGSPILYKQERLTKNNKGFEIIKFRSMFKNSEEEGTPKLAVHNDSRITKVGKTIRRLKIDELPQLFNVLKGEMSLVGPRPERGELVDNYLEKMPEFHYRTRVKAGMTGYAQIMGKYNTSPEDKLKLDLMYIENYSIALDFKILLMTLKAVFIGDMDEKKVI